MYIKESIEKYLDDLAAKLPAPGGGSAAALTGAIGTALILMVCNFTSGKKKYEEFESDIKRISERAESIKRELVKLIDEDVAAYKKFASSEKDDPALQEALSVPMKVAKLTNEAVKLCPELAEKGNRFLISDVGCAAELLEGAFLSAAFNVEINLAAIKGKDFIIQVKKDLEPLKEEVISTKEKVVGITIGKMRST